MENHHQNQHHQNQHHQNRKEPPDWPTYTLHKVDSHWN